MSSEMEYECYLGRRKPWSCTVWGDDRLELSLVGDFSPDRSNNSNDNIISPRDSDTTAYLYKRDKLAR